MNAPGITLAAGTFVMLLLLLFSQCSNRSKEFSVWIGGAPSEISYWEQMVRQYQDSTGYEVHLVRQPTDSDQRRQGLVISLEARQPDPDVFLMDVIWIGQFAYSGWLQPLDSFMTAGDFSTEPFFRRILNYVDIYDSQFYALPVYVDGGLLYYRTDLLAQYKDSVPATWESLVDISEKVQKKERQHNPDFYGFVWQGAQYEGLVCNFLEYISSDNGGMIFDNRFDLTDPANVPALKLMKNLIREFKVSPPNTYTEMKEEQVRRFFQAGNAVFERNWPYAWKLHQQPGSPVRGKVGIAPLPHFPGGESASTLGGWHIGISRWSDEKEKAWSFVRYVTSYKVQKALAIHLGWNPGREDVYSDPQVLAQLPYLKHLKEVFHHSVARPNVPYYTQVSEVIQRYVNQCLAGKIDAPAALDKMQKEISKIAEIYGKKY